MRAALEHLLHLYSDAKLIHKVYYTPFQSKAHDIVGRAKPQPRGVAARVTAAAQLGDEGAKHSGSIGILHMGI